jgi:hypothetical protein
LACASGFTRVAFPIPDWALEAVDCCAKKAAMTKVEVQMRPFKFILVAVSHNSFSSSHLAR